MWYNKLCKLLINLTILITLTVAQYPIPQFIESEAKIVFFLTFRQFFILIGGGAICLILYYLVPFSLFVISAIFIGLATLLVAFLKINDTSIVRFFLDFIMFSIKSKNYVWEKKEMPQPFNIKRPEKDTHGQPATGAITNSLKEIRKLIELKKKKND